MLTFVTIVHVLVCVFMIFVILLQPGKDAGMGSALGGGAATSAFGGRGAVTFLSKLTGVFAALFFFSSLGLSFVGLRSSVAAGGSVASPPAQSAPATSGDAAPGSMEQPRGEQSTPPAEGGGNPATGESAPATQEPAPAQ
ncbi:MULTISPECIES: preprotein translocase subunit SecG [Myxococcus]|uniref:Protein-export membrane protein SecG n=2 Tax=Myxococcus TaxID=32 RepID=A0A511HC16_9BACT|nr:MULTISPECIES: preprotein translocase subunit SecG [Myxococcus]NOJ77734.1 preprotein translocase subunit SecG [Myxococcus xanthus]NOJ91073.1 preprotein translocase subunit SecG [Myxococcus xanthus]GEL71103.1 preprotein translocase subunit SecG [Myxococcus virescens]SDD86860.1 protein translocase subunit secG [Myxococcus virescens]